MSPASAVVSAGGLVLLWLLFTEDRSARAFGTEAAGRARGDRLRFIRPGLPPVLVALGTWVWLDAWGIAASLGLVTALCVSTWRTGRRIRHAADLAESVSSLATILANQATAATTVVDTVRNAAPLASGPVRAAAIRLGDDCEIIGVSAATARFKQHLKIPSAEWLGDIVDISAAGGGRWTEVVHIFESEAGEEAEILRRLLRKVGAQLPTLTAVMVLSVGMVIGLGWMSAEVGRWLLGPQGQMAVGVASGMTAVFVGRTLSSVRMMVR